MRIHDITARPKTPDTPLSYTESLESKLRAQLSEKPAPKYTALEWACMEGGHSIDEGFKDWAVAGAIGLGALTGQGDATAKPQPTAKPGIIQQYQQQKAPEKQPINILSFNTKAEETVHRAALAAGIKGVELAQFMAQTKHESADFSRMKEIGGKGYYTKRYDPKHAPKTAKILGNTKVGDGERYHGRGFIQITGRDNYRMAGQALGLPLEQKPELAAKPDVAAKIAVWYWKTRVKPTVSNFNDTAAVTKAINPAMRGLDDRMANFQEYKKIL
jgi:predicted chitinase